MTQPNPVNANYRRDDIPRWIVGLSALLALILAFQSYSAYFNPALAFGAFAMDTPANANVMHTLGGRNVVMLALTLMAMQSRNAMFLAYTFIMHLGRELQDMFISPYHAGFTTPKGMGVFVVFLVVFVIPEFWALMKLKKIAALP